MFARLERRLHGTIPKTKLTARQMDVVQVNGAHDREGNECRYANALSENFASSELEGSVRLHPTDCPSDRQAMTLDDVECGSEHQVGISEDHRLFREVKGNGGRDRVRTCDPLLAKQVLSQLSYTPTA
jgi:hypothetical protein